jgi:VIT1/CCC1 family predicted Fe2+/Mn2+ transporter
MTAKKISRISYGGTAAIVTSMALITGLNAARTGKSTLITALLIVALADNITDSLSIHIYQESERLEEREAFIGTLSNFITRLLGSLTFVLIVAVFPPKGVVLGSIVWGNLLLGGLTYFLARKRKVGIVAEIIKHLVVAAAAIIISRIIAQLLT